MIAYMNKEQTVRIRKRFDDRAGKYCYYLEKWCPPYKFLWWTIKGQWSDGGTRSKEFRIPPVRTYDLKVVKSWAKHYLCDIVRDKKEDVQQR